MSGAAPSTSARTAMPGIAASLLVERAVLLLLVSPFLLSAVAKLADFPGTIAEVRGLAGLEPAWLFAVAVIVTQLGGSLAIVLGAGRWPVAVVLGALALAGFTVVATLLAHAFWTKVGPERIRDANIFWEHVSICGGLLLAALVALRPRP